MKHIDFSKEFFKSCETQKILFSPNWISDSHWAIRKKFVKNEKIFYNQGVIAAVFPFIIEIKEIKDEKIENLIDISSSEYETFFRTEMIWQDWTIFLSEEEEPKPVLINKNYVDFFDLWRLKGDTSQEKFYDSSDTKLNFLISGLAPQEDFFEVIQKIKKS